MIGSISRNLPKFLARITAQKNALSAVPHSGTAFAQRLGLELAPLDMLEIFNLTFSSQAELSWAEFQISIYIPTHLSTLYFACADVGLFLQVLHAWDPGHSYHY